MLNIPTLQVILPPRGSHMLTIGLINSMPRYEEETLGQRSREETGMHHLPPPTQKRSRES